MKDANALCANTIHPPIVFQETLTYFLMSSDDHSGNSLITTESYLYDTCYFQCTELSHYTHTASMMCIRSGVHWLDLPTNSI